jgi:hypothetical protein
MGSELHAAHVAQHPHDKPDYHALNEPARPSLSPPVLHQTFATKKSNQIKEPHTVTTCK